MGRYMLRRGKPALCEEGRSLHFGFWILDFGGEKEGDRTSLMGEKRGRSQHGKRRSGHFRFWILDFGGGVGVDRRVSIREN